MMLPCAKELAGPDRVEPRGQPGERVLRLPKRELSSLLGLVFLIPGLPAASAPAAEDPSDRFYDPAVVQAMHLEIAPEDLERLHRALPQRISVPGVFRWGDQTLGPVGIRFRGNSSSMPHASHKRSFLVAFAEYRPGLRFLGLRHVALDNGVQFGGLFSEPLITEALRGVGVKASRCNHARVYLNGRPAGVYVNVERIDRSFLERRFPSADGPLFKVDEGGPGADFRYLGSDPTLYRKAFERKGGDPTRAFADLIEFIRAVDTPTATLEDLEARLDVEAFLKTTAVLLLAGAFDQYTGWGPHNYYLYRNPADGRWTYLPWDLDVGFADEAFGQIPVLEGWNAAWPAPVPGRPLMERLIADPILLQRYRQHANDILETWFRPDILVPKLRALHELIREPLAEDPFPVRRVTVPSDTNVEDMLASMESFIRRRYALAREQLDHPGSRPPPRSLPRPPEPPGPRPGPPSADAPSDLRVVRVSTAGVELAWVDHAEGEVAFVVQRATGAEGTDFVNAIGQAGADLTTAVDPNVQPGQTYRYRVYAVLPTPQGPRGTGVSNSVTVSIPSEPLPER